MKRNLASSCTYIHATLTREKPQVQKNGQASRDVQSQVRRLEELVVSLMEKTNRGMFSGGQGGQVTADGSPGESDGLGSIEVEDADAESEIGGRLKDTALSLGKITIGDGNRANYVGSSHWTAILDSVCSTLLHLLG